MTASETDQIERAAELHRDRVSGLLDELRTRLSPGEIVDQMLGSVRDGAAQDFARNLGTQVRNNPLPCVLIGAGMAWLMIGGRNGRANGTASADRAVRADTGLASGLHEVRVGAADAAERAAEAARRARSATADQIENVTTTVSEVAGTASQTYAQTRDAATRSYEQTREAATRTYDKARDTATQTYEQARGRAARTLQGVTEMISNTFGQARGTVDRSVDQLSGATSSAAQAAGDAARQASSGLARLAQEQPLVLAGIGIAIGAALASLFPVTETENRLVGRTSDELKDRARDLATEGVEKVQAVATTAVETATAAVTEAAQQEASRQGLTFGGEHGTAHREEPRERDDATESGSGDATDRPGGESSDAADGRH